MTEGTEIQPESKPILQPSFLPSLPPLVSGLHLLATPIGHAQDITLRGLHALHTADILAAEDTRRLRLLMQLHGIPLNNRPIITCHHHNESYASEKIIDAIQKGCSVVYSSDAGTPLISDPGAILARNVIKAGLAIHSLPGACAAITALSLSGLATDQFFFAGFPPSKSSARCRFFEALEDIPGSLIFYEAPHRIHASLTDMFSVFHVREAVIAREITKKFEQILRSPLNDLIDQIKEMPLKGEIIVILGPSMVNKNEITDDDIIEKLNEFNQLKRSEAIAKTAKALNIARNRVYSLALKNIDTKGQF